MTDPDALIAAYLDGEATDQQQQELAAWLAADPQHIDRFLRESTLNYHLYDQIVQQQFQARAMTEVPADVRPIPAARLERRLQGVGRRARRLVPMSIAVVLLVVCLWLVGRERYAGGPTPQLPIARLAESEGAPLTGSGKTATPGASMSAGIWELGEGAARLEFSNGVAILVQGPAALELVSPGLLRLVHGQVSAKVPPQASGFTIDTHTARVIDRGTEFGVVVPASGVTCVEVFRGLVDVQPVAKAGESRAAQLIRLTAGDSAQFPGDGLDRTGALGEDARPIWLRKVVMHEGITTFFGNADLVLRSSAPASVEDGQLASEEEGSVFLERRGVVLPADVQGGLCHGWQNDPTDYEPVTVPAGTRVDSYLVHYEPLRADLHRKKFRAGLGFDRPVLAVLNTAKQLQQTDAILGSATTRYPATRQDKPGRGAKLETPQAVNCWFSTQQGPVQYRILVAAESQQWKRPGK